MTSNGLKERVPDDQMPAREDFLTARQLSIVLQVSESTIRRMTRENRIPFLRLTTRITRYNLPAVREALEATPRNNVRRVRRGSTAMASDQEDQQQQLFAENV